MTQRITFGQVSNDALREILQNYSDLSQTQEQLATGRRLNRPSDDPVGVAGDLQARAGLAQNTQYQRNINDGTAYLATVDTTLTGNSNLLQNSYQLAIQGSNSTLTANNLVAIAQQMRSNLDQMVAVANTTYNGAYIFSGTNTQVPPYSELNGAAKITSADLTPATVGQPIQIVDQNVKNSNTPSGAADAYNVIPGTVSIPGLTEGKDYAVDYVNGTVTFTPPGTAALAAVNAGGGTGALPISFTWIQRNEADLDGTISRQSQQNQQTRINTTASDVYGADPKSGTFSSMITALDGLMNNKAASVESSIPAFNAAIARNSNAEASNGARVNALTTAGNHVTSSTTNLTQVQSQLEDVDIAAAATAFTKEQTLYNASLQIGATAMQKTLMDFL